MPFLFPVWNYIGDCLPGEDTSIFEIVSEIDECGFRLQSEELSDAIE
jgi:hypothetical protein